MKLKSLRRSIVAIILILVYICMVANEVIAFSIFSTEFIGRDEDNNIKFTETQYSYGYGKESTKKYEVNIIRIDANKEANVPDDPEEKEWRKRLPNGIMGENSYKLNIGEGIKRIGNKSFQNIEKIEGIGTSYSTFTEIGDLAFSGTNIKEIKLPSTCEKIGRDAFTACRKLENVYLNEGLKKIGMYAFSGTAIKEIKLPSTCEKIEDATFIGCTHLENVYFNEGLKEIGDFAFSGTAIKEIKLPSTCEKIGWSAFEDCTKLKKVYLNEGLKVIEWNAFRNCTNLTEIQIPSTVETITGDPFAYCTNLEKIIVSKEQEDIINALKGYGHGDKLKIVGNTYIEDGKIYSKSEILANKKYILVKGSNTSILNVNEDEIIIDEEHSNLSKDEYMTYLIKNKNGDYYVCETDSQGNIILLGKTSTYTGFYNGRAYRDGRILKNVIITLPKGVNVDRNANTHTNYDIIDEDKLKVEIESLKQEKDIYIIDENGELSNNLAGDDSYNVLVGDVNLDGEIGITDIIYLNKYVAGVMIFNDAQLKAADCYSDGSINGLDVVALLRYIVDLERELPIKEKDLTQKQEFEKQMNDEFYNTYIKPKNASFDFSTIAKEIHKEIAEEAKKEEKMQYTDEDVEIKNIYSNKSFGENINSNAYIGLCLYQYGIHTQNEDIVKYLMEYKDQGNYRELYNITEEKLNELGWQKIDYTSKEQLQNGDIIISEKETQIYNEYGVYSCGSNEEIRKVLTSEPIEAGAGKYIIRIEPTSGKCGDNVEWSIDDGELNITGTGDLYEDIDEKIPWKASINKISTVSYGVANQENTATYMASVIDKMQSNTKMRIKDVKNRRMVEVVRLLKSELEFRKSKGIITNLSIDGNDLMVTFQKGYMKGIDISYWNSQGSEIDWKRVAEQGIDFAILKIGYGQESSQKDSSFEKNYREAIAAGIDVGVYYFSYAKSVDDVEKEVDTLITWLKEDGRTLKLRFPIFIDLEADGVGNMDSATLTKIAEKYCEKMSAAGYHNIGIYAGGKWFEQGRIDLSQIHYNVKTWAALYHDMDHSYENSYDMWQYSDEGQIEGIEGSVDMNIAYTKRLLAW